MRNVIFIRDKKFNSFIMPVFIFMDEKYIGDVKNGKKFIHLIDEESHSFYIVWSVSTDPKNTYRYSENLIINESKDDITIRVKNRYSFKEGSNFELMVIE